MRFLLDDRYRSAKLAALALVLLALCLYGGTRQDMGLSFQECLAHPGLCDQQKVLLGATNTQTGKIGDGHFEVIEGQDSITVFGPTENLKEGDYLYLQGIFHKRGYLTLEKLHIRKLRRFKMIVSILPVLLVSGLFFARYRWDTKKRRLVER